MLDRVVLPAPFSPSSACTSPRAASKSIRSLAMTPGNRFVIPRIATAARVGAAVASNSWATGRPTGDARRRLPLRAAQHAFDEPVHPVEAVRAALEDLHPPPLRHAQLAVLVVKGARELVELAGDDLGLDLGDGELRRFRHLRAERGE